MKHWITSLNNKGSEYNILANRNITPQGADSQTECLAKKQASGATNLDYHKPGCPNIWHYHSSIG